MNKKLSTVNCQLSIIRLRAPEPEDIEVMMHYENDTEVWQMSNTTGPYSRYQLKQYIEQTENDLFADRQLRLMVEDCEGRVVGVVDVCTFDPLHNRAEVGILVDKSCRQKGVGKAALAMLEEHLFGRLGIHQLYAYIGVDNEPCRRLFASLGYKESGVLRDWMRIGNSYTDVLLVQKFNSAKETADSATR